MAPRGLVAACAASIAVLAATGCGATGLSESGSGDTASGKQLFQEKCASCHALADAGTQSTIGPNLDDAFRQSRADGLGEGTIRSVVRGQIAYPVVDPPTGGTGMPADLVTGEDAESVAAYVASVAALPVRSQPGEASGGDAGGGGGGGGGGSGGGQGEPDGEAIFASAGCGGGGGGGGSGSGGGQGEPDGEAIFASAGCGGCHVLEAAGSGGTVGPNLDESKPSRELAIDRVTNGKGAMPAFKDSYSAEEIAAVAEFVASNAGK